MTDEQHDSRDPFAGIPQKVLTLGYALAHEAARTYPTRTDGGATALDLADDSVLRDVLDEIASLVVVDEADFGMFNETAALSAIVSSVAADGSVRIDLEAVAAILEGLEREIVEGAKGLRLLHRGESDSRKVSDLERRIAVDALSTYIVLCERSGVDHEHLERSKAVIARLGPIGDAEGNPDKDTRRYVLRNAIIAACLGALQDAGLVPSNYAGVVAEAFGLSKSQVMRAWKTAVNRRGKTPRYGRRCARCGKPVGEDALRIQSRGSLSEDDWDLVCRECEP